MKKSHLTKKEYILIALCLLLIVSLAMTIGTISGKYTQKKTEKTGISLNVETNDTGELGTATATNEGHGTVEFIYPVGP